MTKFSPIRPERLAVLLLVLAGCGSSSSPMDNLPRKAVKGTVTLDGQPLAEGKIQFDPADGSAGLTTIAVGEIKDGKYSIEAATGPIPGNYKVVISSRPPIKVNSGEAPGPLPKVDPEKVPAQFNSKSTLTKEVKNESVNTCDFDLKSS